MKKNLKSGFTLTEAVITMTVIGVVSALLLPMANKFRPDPVKVKYLQTYDAITYVASQLANDSAKFGLYQNFQINGYDENISLDKVPFFNRPKEFCDNFIVGVNAPAGTTCTVPAADSNDKYSTTEFRTSNGTYWNVQAHSNYNANYLNTIFSAVITTNIDGQNFAFVVGADGQTHVADPQGLAYTTTRSSWKNADYDLSKHETSVEIAQNRANEDLRKGLGNEWSNLYMTKQRPRKDESTNTTDNESNISTDNDDGATIQHPNTIVNNTGDTIGSSNGNTTSNYTNEDFDTDGDGLNENDEVGLNQTHTAELESSKGVTHQTFKKQ